MQRIGIVGYYGKFNTGDDAMAAVCLSSLHSCFPKARLYVASQPLVVPSDVAVVWQPLAQPWKHRLRKERQLCEGDCGGIVFGGGSVFSDTKGTEKLEARIREISRLRRRGVRVVGLGIGLGPFHTIKGRALANELLQLFDAIIVRDAASLRLAEQLDLPLASLGFDPAVLVEEIGLPQPPPFLSQKSAKRTLGVSLCNYARLIGKDRYVDDDRIAKVIHGLTALDSRTWRLKLLVMQGHPRVGDLKVASRLATALGGDYQCEIAHYDPNPLRLLGEIRRCDAVVSMRLHGAVYAYLAGRPFGMLAYHPKCRALAEIVQLPSSFVLDADTFSPNDFAALIAELIESPAASHELMPVRNAQRLAQEGLERAAVALAQGDR